MQNMLRFAQRMHSLMMHGAMDIMILHGVMDLMLLHGAMAETDAWFHDDVDTAALS